MDKKIGPNTSISKTSERVGIKITSQIEGWMSMAIFGWVMVWSGMGAYVLFYILFAGLTSDEQLFFAAYLAFWSWFEYKALYAWLFKKYGYELITITDGVISYSRKLFFLNRNSTFDVSTISPSRKALQSERTFAAAYSKSFWVVGNEQIEFSVGEKTIRFGMHLTPKETTEVIRFFNQAIKKLS